MTARGAGHRRRQSGCPCAGRAERPSGGCSAGGRPFASGRCRGGVRVTRGSGEVSGRYRGLSAGQGGSVTLDGAAVLVKPSAANQQFAADRAKQDAAGTQGGATYTAGGGGNTQIGEGGITSPGGNGGTAGSRVAVAKTPPRRFYGSATLDATRAGRDAARIAEEVPQHLNSLMGADVEVTLEIQARVPEGVPENVVRTVTENCRVLKFDTHAFEQE